MEREHFLNERDNCRRFKSAQKERFESSASDILVTNKTQSPCPHMLCYFNEQRKEQINEWLRKAEKRANSLPSMTACRLKYADMILLYILIKIQYL
jgi:hypothetical protein